MPVMDSEVAPMEDRRALEEGRVTDGPFPFAPTSVPSSTPSLLNTTGADFTSEPEIEMKAVSMASNNCSSTSLSSPAEASPAKPVVASPTLCHSPTEPYQATSQLASESLMCTETSLVKLPQSSPLLPSFVFTKLQSSNTEGDFPTVLTHKGVSVTLENNSVWKQFHSCTTEMILTKQGRRMFPYCRYRLSGLEPTRMYSLFLSIVPVDQYKYRWSNSKWEPSGVAEHYNQGLFRAFSHHYSPSQGSALMTSLVSFYKLKLTNNMNDQEGHIILHSMHRYIPRLHVIPVVDGEISLPDKLAFMGPECLTFIFPQTEFMAVTTYQNFRITQLKINHNPFAKGFREEGSCSRLNRIITEVRHVAKAGDPIPDVKSEVKEEDVELSLNGDIDSTSITKTRLVLKPIMSSSPGNAPFVNCLRGKHALGELVLVEDQQCVVPKKEPHVESLTPKARQRFRASTPGSSLRLRKRGRRINRRWANSHGRRWKAAPASPTVVHSPSLTVAMQPELDDVEGLLFVSFSSKEALEFHIRDKSPSSPPPSTNVELKETNKLGVSPEGDEENIPHLEAVLLQDLSLCRHRQVLHPVLQEVGLKLSCLDPATPVDLKYLGIHLPLPPPELPEQSTITSPSDEGLSFISRTGKTSDMTKIKGWKSKFIKSKETCPGSDGSQKNLSAFCSNMLDEYLESEAQKISERAAAFSTNPEGRVSYQLPAKSSSYVKTLDSVLKHRGTASKSAVGSSRPCPLSHKHLFNFAQSSLAQTDPVSPKGSPSVPRSAPSHLAAELKACSTPASHGTSPVQQTSSAHQPVGIQRSVTSQGLTYRSSALTKFQSKLLEMEIGTLNEGLSRTQLTNDRLGVALSVLLTKEMQPSQILKVAKYPVDKTTKTECGWDFCRLGCLCASLQYSRKGPLHCQRPECMFGCACFKRKITKQLITAEDKAEGQPVYSMTNMEHPSQPQRGFHAKTLWKCSTNNEDPEPVFAPSGARPCLAPIKAAKRSSLAHQSQQNLLKPLQVREDDKDPVYKYLESMMTCARVRGFRERAPPEVNLEPKIIEKPPQLTAFDEKEARKQIEIQSGCHWRKDRKKVLEELCRRMNQNNIPESFIIEPYQIRLITKIVMQKPSGSVIKYRLHISEPSANDEEKSESSDKEMHASDGEDMETVEEEEEPVMRYGVTPFLSGVLPAGKLRARTKPVGCQASGLIQVNGKTYNQARLLLGTMGSLHPANRLAAYITGRVNLPAEINKKTLKSDPTNKANTPAILLVKAAGTETPSTITPRTTAKLKNPTQQPVQQSELESSNKGFVALLLPPQSAPSKSPVQTITRGDICQSTTFQNSSMTSNVSLTVSPSLKTPSFLGQTGTFSFRICPPTNQGTKSQTQQGVLLPGGFTLIQLPSQNTNGDSQQVPCENTVGTANLNWLGLDIAAKARELLSSEMVKPEFFTAPKCNDDTSSEESVELNRQVESGGNDSESLDFSEESDEVDVETIDGSHELVIDRIKEDARKALVTSRNSQDGFRSPPAASIQAQPNSSKQQKGRCESLKILNRRETHTWVERLRRSELRELFDKLHTILQTNPKPPRLHLLSMAQNEIKSLVEASKYLEDQKTKLIQKQQAYLKELSLLTGRSEKVIQDRLKEFYKEEKLKEKTMKWSPFFSNLLQSRAALLQADNSEAKKETIPLLPSDFLLRPSQHPSNPVAAQNTAVLTPLRMQHFQPEVTKTMSPELKSVAAPSPHDDRKDKISDSVAQMSVKATTSTQKPDAIQPVKEISFPLVRSKSGRIILPSSLKPICQNILPVVGEKSKLAGETGEKPAKKQKTEPDQPAEIISVTEEDKTLQSPNSKPTPPCVNTPMASVTFLNKSMLLVQKALHAAEQIPTVGPQAAPTQTPVQRSRGRPRKTPRIQVKLAPASERRGHSVKSLDHSQTAVAEGPKENGLLTTGDSPLLLKRGRGRPPKRSSSEGLWNPPVIQGSVTPKSEDIPERFSKESRKARPLTRAALGKDFPSAKKRSWIDIEKELEQDTDSE
ncbi:MAX gene-associated protein isoform X2 [Takifugu rubripes]|uniref:MAX gene-associated protein isoform X2 n=1 Tax=Takifugu rubripes TaxID=31033 RepID=UPI0011454E63|nr:MAX gene-associated protein-like isoform X2 [Takifugu rubripes]